MRNDWKLFLSSSIRARMRAHTHARACARTHTRAHMREAPEKASNPSNPSNYEVMALISKRKSKRKTRCDPSTILPSSAGHPSKPMIPPSAPTSAPRCVSADRSGGYILVYDTFFHVGNALPTWSRASAATQGRNARAIETRPIDAPKFITLLCLQCGRTFQAPRNARSRHRRICSDACRRARAAKPRRPRPRPKNYNFQCAVCSAPFSTYDPHIRCCSRSCGKKLMVSTKRAKAIAKEALQPRPLPDTSAQLNLFGST